jgi:hypothetical protein
MRCSLVFSRVLTARICNWVFKLSSLPGEDRRLRFLEKVSNLKERNWEENIGPDPARSGLGPGKLIITKGKCQRQSSTIGGVRREFPAKARLLIKRPLQMSEG